MSISDPSPVRQPPPDFYDPADGDNVCYLCGEPSYRLVHRVTHYGFPFEFKRCQCGLIKQTPMPNQRFFEWFFNSEVFFSSRRTGNSEIWGFYDYFKDEPCRLATSRLRYRRLRDFLDRGSLEILKIGPATGTFLHVANQHGHHAIGCDVSERFVDYARTTYGVQIDRGRFERMGYAEGRFDVILLFNVIENVPNQSEFLTAVRRALKPGGLFILNFVDEQRNLVAALQKDRYFLYRPPICYVYSLPVMRRVLARFGFETVTWYRDIRYLHLEKVSTLLGWRWLLALARGLRIHRLPFPIYAYPSRILVARRPSGEA
jgi:SAM-dependent methyltransferase